jgi:hypothetical protein
MGGKVLRLLRRFLNLWRRWKWGWIGFIFDLVGVGVACVGYVICGTVGW